jgi:hypothetical protein
MATRIRDVRNKDDMQRVIDDFMTTGYVVKEQGMNSAMLQKHSWGTAIGWILAIVVGIVLGVFTVGIGFIVVVIAYAVIAHVTAPKVLLRIQGQQGSVAPMVTD